MTATLASETLPATEEGIARAAALLGAGHLVAFPTETVYGLGGDATRASAVAAIFAAKGRPAHNPLICHYPTAAAAFADVAASPLAERLAAAFWPGPLTLVLPRRAECAALPAAGANLATLAVRVPSHPLARALLARLAFPLAAPSANRSGRVSPTLPAHVLADLGGRIAAVIDAGASPVGVESTVLDLSGPAPVLLRPGGVAEEAIIACIGPLARPAADPARPRAPGQLASHYAPRLALRLDARAVGPDEALLAFGPALPGAALTFNLSEAGDPAEAAARLFAGLHHLDAEGARRGLAAIAAMAIPEHGLGRAVNDRLRRAAAPRADRQPAR